MPTDAYNMPTAFLQMTTSCLQHSYRCLHHACYILTDTYIMPSILTDTYIMPTAFSQMHTDVYNIPRDANNLVTASLRDLVGIGMHVVGMLSAYVVIL